MTAHAIKDGTGTGRLAGVGPNNRLDTHAVIETGQANRTREGDSHNLSTGAIALTSENESAVFYFKNTHSKSFFIEAFFLTVGTRPSPTEAVTYKIIRNPTGGTIISTATAIGLESNHDFSSAKSLTKIAYNGAEAKTFTDGTEAISVHLTNARTALPVNILLPQGTSIGVTCTPNDTTGMLCQVALVGYYLDPEIT